MQSILAIKTFQQPENSQGVLYQEWAAIGTILCLPDEEQKGPTDLHCLRFHSVGF